MELKQSDLKDTFISQFDEVDLGQLIEPVHVQDKSKNIVSDDLQKVVSELQKVENMTDAQLQNDPIYSVVIPWTREDDATL